MILKQAGTPLLFSECAKPKPETNEVLLKVVACGVCRTDLHIVDGELAYPALPLILGHQIIGIIEKTGSHVTRFNVGDRVGVPWLGQTCGTCEFCLVGHENLCSDAVFTGYTHPGGFAQFTTANEQFCFVINSHYPDHQAAPLLCAGLIGFRAYRFTNQTPLIGVYGFGAAAHILCQVAVHQQRKIFAFTRPGDIETQIFARSLGAFWAGDSNQLPPELLDAAIIFAPDGKLIPLALKSIKPGGKVICAGIHMSDIPSFSYDILWGERSILSVANITRCDGDEFLRLAPKIPVQTSVTTYPLSKTNQALSDLRTGKIHGSAVVMPWQ